LKILEEKSRKKYKKSKTSRMEATTKEITIRGVHIKKQESKAILFITPLVICLPQLTTIAFQVIFWSFG
jgi:hypothetical protein